MSQSENFLARLRASMSRHRPILDRLAESEKEDCGFDGSRVTALMADIQRRHADYHWPNATGLQAVRRGIFLSRGGHAPGDQCDWTDPLTGEDACDF